MPIDSIYLNKRPDSNGEESNNTSDWVYYRITGATGLGVPAGEEGSSVQMCKVTWPHLKDDGPVTDTPGQVALNAAYPGIQKVVAAWGIEHDKSILIGLRESAEK